MKFKPIDYIVFKLFITLQGCKPFAVGRDSDLKRAVQHNQDIKLVILHHLSRIQSCQKLCAFLCRTTNVGYDVLSGRCLLDLKWALPLLPASLSYPTVPCHCTLIRKLNFKARLPSITKRGLQILSVSLSAWIEPSIRMQFPRVVTKVGIQSQELTTQSQHVSDMPFLYPTRNQLHTVFNHHTSSCFQIQNGSGLVDSSEVETRVNGQQEYVKVGGQVRLELDDLSAVVGKCNVNPLLSVDGDGRRLSNYSAAQYQSQVMWDCDNRTLLHGQIGAVPSTSKPLKVDVEEPLKSLKRKRSVNTSPVPSSLLRKSHVLSERLRRREMNELFAEMRSLLPNPKAKSDKASILSETMNYIHFLQRRLAIHSTNATTLPIKLEPMSSVPEAIEASWDEKLSLKYNGREILITVISAKKRNLLPSIMLVVESLNLQVMDAYMSVTEPVELHFLHLKAADILDHVVKETLRRTISKLIESEYQISFKPSEKAKMCDASA